MPRFDAILVPGGGVREGGALPEWVARRFDLARQLYQGEFIIALSAGTPHRPPPLDGGFPVFESAAAARYLIAAGVPAEKILIETSSYDTIGNAFFARTIHTDPAGLRNLAVVTSAFHMARVRRVFEWVFALDAAGYQLTFFETPDAGLGADTLAARAAKERSAVEALDQIIAATVDLRSLHRWLFLRHTAYAAGSHRNPLGRGALGDSY